MPFPCIYYHPMGETRCKSIKIIHLKIFQEKLEIITFSPSPSFHYSLFIIQLFHYSKLSSLPHILSIYWKLFFPLLVDGWDLYLHAYLLPGLCLSLIFHTCCLLSGLSLGSLLYHKIISLLSMHAFQRRRPALPLEEEKKRGLHTARTPRTITLMSPSH